MSFQIIYVIQADPKGWIPKWAVNMFAWQQALNVSRIRKIIEVLLQNSYTTLNYSNHSLYTYSAFSSLQG